MIAKFLDTMTELQDSGGNIYACMYIKAKSTTMCQSTVSVIQNGNDQNIAIHIHADCRIT